MQKYICFHTREKASMVHASKSGCHETNFGSFLLILLANNSKSGVPNIFIFLKTTGLTCHSEASFSFFKYKFVSRFLQPGMCATEIHKFLSMHHSQISFASELQSSDFWPPRDSCKRWLLFCHT